LEGQLIYYSIPAAHIFIKIIPTGGEDGKVLQIVPAAAAGKMWYEWANLLMLATVPLMLFA
jgi:hypothetical protein